MPVVQKSLFVLSLVASATGALVNSVHRLEHSASFLKMHLREVPAPGPAPAPFDVDKYMMNGMNEEKPAPEQGFDGDRVEHNDMSTMNEDWQSEHSTHHPCDHCHLYPDNTWCRDMCKPPAKKQAPMVQPVVQHQPKAPPAEKSMLDKFLDALKDIGKAIGAALSKAMDAVKDLLKNVFGSIGDALAKGMAAIKDFLKDIFGWDSGSFRSPPLFGAGLALLSLVASQ